MKRQPKQFVMIVLFAFVCVAAITAIFLTAGKPQSRVKTQSSIPRPAPAESAAPRQAPAATPGEVALRPLPVALTRNTHEWTALDAKDPGVIERIAHNPEESKRLAEENTRIKRRQLVYRKETIPNLLQRFGEHSLKEFTLPGLDGREFEVEVVETRLNGLQAGSVLGRVKGVLNSMVSVGFYNGCESFNLCLPDENWDNRDLSG